MKKKSISLFGFAVVIIILAAVIGLAPSLIRSIRQRNGAKVCCQNLLALERQYLSSNVMEQVVEAGLFSGDFGENGAHYGGCPSGGRYVPCMENGRRRLRCTVHGLTSGGIFSEQK